MNYTKNYHLPQWVKEDRVMMEDFNAAMADIESGLTQNKAFAEAGLAQNKASADAGIAQAKTAAADAAKTANAAVVPADLRSGLFRTAYNHYWLAAAQDAPLRQTGLVRQPFGKGLGSWDGLELLADRARMYNNGDAELNMDSVRSTMTVSGGSATGTDMGTITFTAPGAGRLTGLTYYGNLYQNPGSTGDCTIRLSDLTAGTSEDIRSSFHFTAGSCTQYFTPAVDLALHAGRRYQIKVTLDSTAANHDISFQRNSANALVLESDGSGASFSQSWQLKTDEASRGGLALVRYQVYEQGGSVRLNWDGTDYQPYKVRTITDEAGRTVQEAEFRRTTAVPASSSLTITAACPVGGELELFEMGAVLI